MAQIPFAGGHTEAKLVALDKYIERYTTALKRQSFELIYLDAFAGTGDIPFSRDLPPSLFEAEFPSFIEGSAKRALKYADRFSRFVFAEKSRSNVDMLDKLRFEFPTANIHVIQGDANAAICGFCRETDWRKTRAIAFLDPFGNQVKWSTIEMIAQTRAIDLWYLFPAGLGVDRQIASDGTVHFTHEASLDELFGTSEWRTRFLDETIEPDLLDGLRPKSVKTATPESITKFMLERMGRSFAAVLPEWLSLGRNNAHHYSLLFAVANPRATHVALPLAKWVIGSTKRGRRK